jgi:hypothetical protein
MSIYNFLLSKYQNTMSTHFSTNESNESLVDDEYGYKIGVNTKHFQKSKTMNQGNKKS